MAENTCLQIEKHSDLYNLIIPQEVENKIRHLCNKISKVEWSGILFYTYSGSYEEKNLEIKCVDILLMDIGSSTYTEFYVSPDVVNYMTIHPELLECQVGLIHSHNSMATFFSGTDLSTLQEEGNDRNHFVSLIVNNEGTYTAAITRKLNIKRTSNTTFTYKTFNDIEKEGTETKETTEEIISYNFLNIIKEGETVNFQEIEERIKEINDNKNKEFKTHPITNREKLLDIPYNKREWFQPTLFSDEIDKYSCKNTIKIDENTVKTITLQLITGAITISENSKLDPVKWSKQMVSVFYKRFDNITVFEEWINMFADFILNNSIPLSCAIGDEDKYVSELCKEVHKTLSTLPSNIYINTIKDTLTLWILD